MLPREIRLDQNYPNPFNGTTVIPFSLPRAMDVDLLILDILGRQVARIALGALSAGDHRAVWDGAAGRVSSGHYFYTLASGGRPASSVRPLVLLR